MEDIKRLSPMAGGMSPARMQGRGSAKSTTGAARHVIVSPGKRRLVFWLTMVYVFIVHHGSLFRFSTAENSPGLSTVLAAVIILVGFSSIKRGLLNHPTCKLLTTLCVLAFLASAFSPFGFVEPLISLAKLMLYYLVALVVASQYFSRKEISQIILASVSGLFLASAMTIVDSAGLVKIPKCNELQYTSKVHEGAKMRRVSQASGFFARRSAMAAYYCISIVSAYFLILGSKNIRVRLLGVAAFAAGLGCVMSTHNRSAVISVILSVLCFVAFRKSVSSSKRINLIIGTAVVGIVSGWLALVFMSDHIDVYLSKFSYLTSNGAAGESQSDLGRIKLLHFTLDQMWECPLGHGLTSLKLANGRRYSPHNIVTALIWAIGLWAFLWVPMFAYAMSQIAKIKKSALADLLLFSLLAGFLNSMTHDSLFTGLAWVYFGLLLTLPSNVGMSNAPPRLRRPHRAA